MFGEKVIHLFFSDLNTQFKGPICGDTGEELTLLYGVDAMVRCVWIIDQPLYNFMRNVINGQAQYRCRIPLSKGNSLLHVPFAITLWGAVEDTHIHVMNHLQFVFHVVDGIFLNIFILFHNFSYRILLRRNSLRIKRPFRYDISRIIFSYAWSLSLVFGSFF